LKFLVPYAFDGFNSDGTGGEGSRARCDALKKWVDKDDVVILSAGFTKSAPDTPSPEHSTSLAEFMGKHIQQNWKPTPVIHYSTPLVWGTLAETVAAVSFIESTASKDAEVWIATNPFHLVRVWMCWRFLASHRWKLHFVPAFHYFSWRSRFKEFISVPVYFHRLLKIRRSQKAPH
jgi:hypothetical protein